MSAKKNAANNKAIDTKKTTASKKKAPAKPAAAKAAPAPAPAKDVAGELKRALSDAESTIVSLEAQLAEFNPQSRLQLLLLALRLVLKAIRPQKRVEAWDPLAAAQKALAERAEG